MSFASHLFRSESLLAAQLQDKSAPWEAPIEQYNGLRLGDIVLENRVSHPFTVTVGFFRICVYCNDR